MRTIGIYTHDFSIFHDIVRSLKERNVEFFSLSSGMVPPWITVVITTEDCRTEILFDDVIVIQDRDVEKGVEQAVLSLTNPRTYNALVIGIDPGEKPGIAVYGDRELLTTAKVEFPEDTAAIVKQMMDFYRAASVIVRIGHGAPTYRNRIINSILPLNLRIEIVDEHSTTSQHPTPDVQAAKMIGLKEGRPVNTRMTVSPTKGELDDIKRRSRVISNGRFTITTDTAELVARGEMSLEDAVERKLKRMNGERGEDRAVCEDDETGDHGDENHSGDQRDKREKIDCGNEKYSGGHDDEKYNDDYEDDNPKDPSNERGGGPT